MLQTTKSVAFFDMDNTISEGYLEMVFVHKLSEEERQSLYKLSADHWGVEVQKLIQKFNPSRTEAQDMLKQIPLVEGIKDVLTKLKEMNFDLVINSGANDYLCQKYL